MTKSISLSALLVVMSGRSKGKPQAPQKDRPTVCTQRQSWLSSCWTMGFLVDIFSICQELLRRDSARNRHIVISLSSGRGDIWLPTDMYLRCLPKLVLVPRLLLSLFTCSCYVPQNHDPSYLPIFPKPQAAPVQELPSPQLLILLITCIYHPPPFCSAPYHWLVLAVWNKLLLFHPWSSHFSGFYTASLLTGGKWFSTQEDMMCIVYMLRHSPLSASTTDICHDGGCAVNLAYCMDFQGTNLLICSRHVAWVKYIFQAIEMAVVE